MKPASPSDLTPHESEIRWVSTTDTLMEVLEPHWSKVEAVLKELQAKHDAKRQAALTRKHLDRLK